MKIKLRNITFESVFFYSCLGISLLAIILNPVNPTLDGPSHLYNSKLINYLLSGNQFISHYYTLNKIPVPNLTDHYLLALLMAIFRWKLAEILLIVIYLLSFSILFRKLIYQWNRGNIVLSIFAIPFSFSSFYYMGFYNFCLSFSILFGMLIYYRKFFISEENKPNVSRYFVLCLLATLLYFTNGLAFLFAGISLFFLEIGFPATIKPSGNSKINLKRIVLFFLIWLPGLICFLVFMVKVHTNPTNKRIALHDMFHWLNVLKTITYSASDEGYTRLIACLICISMSIGIYNRIKKIGARKIEQYDFFLVLSAISVICFILVPDDSSVGMMSFRFSYFFFVFIVLWAALLPNNRLTSWLISFSVIAIYFTMFFKIHQPIIFNLNEDMEAIEAAGKVIKPNSVVLAKDYTNNWLLFHFVDYLGMNKPLVILENYEADDGWFATKWNEGNVPDILINGHGPNLGYYNMICKPSHEKKVIDYIFVYGNYKDTIQRPDARVMGGILSKEYKLIYTSADSIIHVFSWQSSGNSL